MQSWELWFSRVSSGTCKNVGWGRQCLHSSALEHVLAYRRSIHLLHGTFGRLLCFQMARLKNNVWSSASACFSAAFFHGCTSQSPLKYSFFTSCLLLKRLEGMSNEEQLRTEFGEKEAAGQPHCSLQLPEQGKWKRSCDFFYLLFSYRMHGKWFKAVLKEDQTRQ